MLDFQEGSPSTKSFVAKLKDHLLLRVLLLHPNSNSMTATGSDIFLNNDRLYQHQILTIHYTTYDVRRRRDIIHPGPTSSHRDIMGVLPPDEQTETSRFWFAHVLGIFHTNVIYSGEGASDYNPRRLDFLWVRYYVPVASTSSSPSSLDMLSFPPVHVEQSFGFVDPATVLRCCHIIPAFFKGPRPKTVRPGHVSAYAKSNRDWNAYFINQFVSTIY
jgi:hypothetical protein